MTIEQDRRWSPQPTSPLNATAKAFQPQDVVDTLLDRVYSPLAASIWHGRPTTTLPVSTRTHSRFSHSSPTGGDGREDTGTGDAEVVAMLKLSTNLHTLSTTQEEGDVESELASSKLFLRAPSPSSTAIFSADLEKVNAWFRDELQDDTQRLMVVFSLVQLMPEWQQDFLVQLLDQKKKSRGAKMEPTPTTTSMTSIIRPPPGLDSKPPSPIEHASHAHSTTSKPASAPPRVPSGPLSWRRAREGVSSITATTTTIEETHPTVLASPAPRRASVLIQQDMCDAFPGHYHQQTTTLGLTQSLTHSPTPQDDTYASLFWSDLRSWLRCLRLHKYEHVFQSTDRQTILHWSSHDLEKAGVGAMGARNKFLRLFEQIKEQQQRQTGR